MASQLPWFSIANREHLMSWALLECGCVSKNKEAEDGNFLRLRFGKPRTPLPQSIGQKPADRRVEMKEIPLDVRSCMNTGLGRTVIDIIKNPAP